MIAVTRVSLASLPVAAALVLLDQRALGLLLFVLIIVVLESLWWRAHPEVPRTLRARWRRSLAFYAQVHADPRNRLLHIVGIPFIWYGCVACVLLPSQTAPWWAGAASFGVGWLLNGVGHKLYEPESGAYEPGSVDMLSIVTSVVWDIGQSRRTLREFRALRRGRRGGAREDSEDMSVATG